MREPVLAATPKFEVSDVTMETAACNLCGSTRWRRCLVAEDFKYKTPGPFTIVRCLDCGLAYLNPRPTPEAIGAFYPADCVEHMASSTPNAFAWAEAARVRSRSSSPGRILDIGCASGYFLAAMRQTGWEVYGLEPDREACRQAESVEGAHVLCGTLAATTFSSQMFDVVTLWSVLEHLHDPCESLRTVHRILKPDGFLHLGVPNYSSLERRVFGTRWFGLDVPRHLYHFEPSSIRAMLRAGGFQILELEHASGHDVLKYSIATALRGRPSVEVDQRRNGMAIDCIAGERPRFDRQVRRFGSGLLVSAFTSLADRTGQGSQMLVVAQPE
jgi:SAM-dependent methyltransferase